MIVVQWLPKQSRLKTAKKKKFFFFLSHCIVHGDLFCNSYVTNSFNNCEERKRLENSSISYIQYVCVRVLLCVSSVPASCVHIWFVSCPCFMSLLVNLCPGVFM